MGEAVYYCKIYFESERAARTALPKVKKFFRQGIKAHNYWQAHRDGTTPISQFWLDIDKKFPEVSNYLKHDKLHGKDKNNELAGLLDFGSQDDLDRLDVGKDDSGWAIWYSAMVWHFADWDPMLTFAQKQYGATRYSWVSDEYAELFDLCK
jgi:hypothetical protein